MVPFATPSNAKGSVRPGAGRPTLLQQRGALTPRMASFASFTGGHLYGFYQRVGYTIVGVLPDANGFGRPDIFMAKRIVPLAEQQT